MAFQKMSDAELSNIFMHHAPAPHQTELYAAIRLMGLQFAKTIRDICPVTPWTTRAINHVDEAVMLANASIARSAPELTNSPEIACAAATVAEQVRQILVGALKDTLNELQDLRRERAVMFVALEPLRKHVAAIAALEQGDDRTPDGIARVVYADPSDSAPEGTLTLEDLRRVVALVENAENGAPVTQTPATDALNCAETPSFATDAHTKCSDSIDSPDVVKDARNI